MTADRTQASPEMAAITAAAQDFVRAAAELPGGKRLTDQQVEMVYTLGHRYFTQGRYDQAIHLLVTASLYRPAQPRYLKALGICHKMRKNHEAAIQAFGLMTALEPGNPEPALHVVECLLGLQRTEEAVHLLRTVVEFVRLSGEHAPVRERAENLLALVGP